jgi:hypothetical protein
MEAGKRPLRLNMVVEAKMRAVEAKHGREGRDETVKVKQGR